MTRIRFAQTVLLYAGIRISHAGRGDLLADGRRRARKVTPMQPAGCA